MSAQFEKNSNVGNLNLHTKKIVFDLSIVHNATPASKTSSNDLPGVAYLRSEGLTAVVDAIETVTWTTAVDATNCVIGVMLKASELGSIKRVKKVEVSQVVATGTAIVVRPPNSGSSFLSSGGNIVIEIVGTGTDLASEDPTFCIDIDYELSAI